MSSIDFDSLFEALFGAILAGVVLWQLVTGKALNSGWRVAYTRHGKPLTYWFLVGGQAAIVLAYFVLRYT